MIVGHKGRIIITSLAFLILISVLGGCFSNSTDTFTSFTSFTAKYERTDLANGLEVIALNNNDLPLITLVGAFKVGAIYQSDNNRGIFHLIEHLLFIDVEEDLNQIGAVANAMTSQDHVIVHLSFTKDYWSEGLKILSKMMRNPPLREETLIKERQIVLAEAAERLTNIDERLWDLIRAELWTEETQSFDVLGDASTLETITVDDLRTIHDQYFRPERSLIAVAGDIRGIDWKQDIEKYFSDWDRGEPIQEPVFNESSLSSDQEIYYFDEKRGTYTSLYMVWEGPGLDEESDDSHIADLLCAVMNNPDSYFAKQIQNLGYVRDFYIYYASKRYKAPFVLQAVVKQSDIEKARKDLTKIMRRKLFYYLISKKIINQSKEILNYQWIIAQERLSEQAKLYAKIWTASDLDYAIYYIDKVKGITKRDLIRFGNKYLIKEPCVTGAVVNQAAKNE